MMDFENAKQQLMDWIGASPFSWKLAVLAEVEQIQTWDELQRMARQWGITFQ